jgi:hypothetical protein
MKCAVCSKTATHEIVFSQLTPATPNAPVLLCEKHAEEYSKDIPKVRPLTDS